MRDQPSSTPVPNAAEPSAGGSGSLDLSLGVTEEDLRSGYLWPRPATSRWARLRASCKPVFDHPVISTTIGGVCTVAVVAMIASMYRQFVDQDTTTSQPAVISSSNDSALQIVDVGFIEPEEDYPQLDIKLRNTGDSVAFLKRASFRVARAWKIDWPPPQGAGPVKPTWNYDVAFPKMSDPFTVSHNVSQIIDPDDADRFTITVGVEGEREETTNYVYLMTVELVYDEDEKTISSGPILVAMPSVWSTWGVSSQYTPPQYHYLLDQGKSVLNEINEINAVKSPRLQKMMNVLGIT